MLSKAFDKSIATMPTYLSASNASRQCSVNFNKTCWQLYPFLYADTEECEISMKNSVIWSENIHVYSKPLDLAVSSLTDLKFTFSRLLFFLKTGLISANFIPVGNVSLKYKGKKKLWKLSGHKHLYIIYQWKSYIRNIWSFQPKSDLLH